MTLKESFLQKRSQYPFGFAKSLTELTDEQLTMVYEDIAETLTESSYLGEVMNEIVAGALERLLPNLDSEQVDMILQEGPFNVDITHNSASMDFIREEYPYIPLEPKKERIVPE